MYSMPFECRPEAPKTHWAEMAREPCTLEVCFVIGQAYVTDASNLDVIGDAPLTHVPNLTTNLDPS
jgi:hypothetical protein